MRNPESRLERMEAIERKLAQRPEGWTTGELAREFGVDPSTIFRDFSDLEEMGTGVHREGRHWVLDFRRSLYNVKLTDNEVLALYLAARLLSRHSDEHNPHVVRALDKLADAVRIRSPLMARHIDEAASSVRERRTRPEYVEVLEILTRAWIEGYKVRLRYWSYTKDETTERVFAPYYIEPSAIGYACHVIGYDDLRRGIRTLKVERIREAELTGERFIPQKNFDVRRLLASAWGIVWNEEDEIEVRLRFAPRVVRRLKESTWHHSQRIEDLPDGSCLFTVRVGSTLELKPWVRQWGAAVEVLAPEDFRTEIADEAQALAALYVDPSGQ